MSMKNFDGTIGNRTRDLPACSAVLQLRHRVPPAICLGKVKFPWTSNYTVWVDNDDRQRAVHSLCRQTNYLYCTSSWWI